MAQTISSMYVLRSLGLSDRNNDRPQQSTWRRGARTTREQHIRREDKFQICIFWVFSNIFRSNFWLYEGRKFIFLGLENFTLHCIKWKYLGKYKCLMKDIFWWNALVGHWIGVVHFSFQNVTWFFGWVKYKFGIFGKVFSKDIGEL